MCCVPHVGPGRQRSRALQKLRGLTVGDGASVPHTESHRSFQEGVQPALVLLRPSWLQQQLLALFSEGLGLSLDWRWERLPTASRTGNGKAAHFARLYLPFLSLEARRVAGSDASQVSGWHHGRSDLMPGLSSTCWLQLLRGFCDPVVLVEVLDKDGETLAAARPGPRQRPLV